MAYKVESTSDKNKTNTMLYTEADIFNIFETIKRNISMLNPDKSDITKNDCLLIIDVNFCLLNATHE